MALSFLWNGQPVDARDGDSIAAALIAAGVRRFGTSHTGRPRGLYCGMGTCQDCVVVVDGVRGRRACMTEVTQAMSVAAQDDRAYLGAEPAAPPQVTRNSVDLAVIGAGPAGLSAALEASRGGARVCVVDARHQTGGQYFKPRSSGFRGRAAPDRQHRRGTALRHVLADSPVARFCGEDLWFARPEPTGDGFDLRTIRPGGQRHITARALILATGATERPAHVPGWTRAGVMSIGAAQTLARRYGVVPDGPILIAGHGPLGLQLAVEIHRLGGNVVAVVERATPRPGLALLRAARAAPRLVVDGLGYRLRLAAARVPVLSGWEAVEVAEGCVRLQRLADGARREIRADTVCLGDGFAPQAELARLLGVPVTLAPDTAVAVPTRDPEGGTHIPGLWIAGDAGGIGGAAVAEAMGRQSATAALHWLGMSQASSGSVSRAIARARRFQDALWDIYAAPPRGLPEDTATLCRCEDVSAAQVRAAIADGARDVGAIKRATRLGMGRCQGRGCLAPALRLLGAAGLTPPPAALAAPQIPASPVPVAALCLEKPEWSGHRDSSPGARPGGADPRPLQQGIADLVIIGAGVTGLSAALHAARAGASVVCLDRGVINGEASGGNAGSLHLQLLSWDFGDKAVAGGTPQLQTLPLQQEAIALWTELQTELDADFEMSVTGGLMVADDPAQIRFLEAKVAAEARVGIASEVVDAARIATLVPAISSTVVAGAWCPGEGKINPLAASSALARAALAQGAVIEERTPVTGLSAEGDGYVIDTPRGRLGARRLLIAAGGWSAPLARMLGADLPIRGAPLQMVVTDPAPPLVPCLLAHANRHLTMKQTDAGSILIGGAWTAVTGPNGQPQVLPESLEGNLWVAAHTIPAIGQLSVIRSWAAMNIDIDGAPMIGALPGHPGVTIAASANGYTLGPLLGREAAAMALSGKARQDLACFAPERPGFAP